MPTSLSLVTSSARLLIRPWSEGWRILLFWPYRYIHLSQTDSVLYDGPDMTQMYSYGNCYLKALITVDVRLQRNLVEFSFDMKRTDIVDKISKTIHREEPEFWRFSMDPLPLAMSAGTVILMCWFCSIAIEAIWNMNTDFRANSTKLNLKSALSLVL